MTFDAQTPYERYLVAEIERLKTLAATLHKGVCAGYADLLQDHRRLERENETLRAVKETQ